MAGKKTKDGYREDAKNGREVAKERCEGLRKAVEGAKLLRFVQLVILNLPVFYIVEGLNRL